MKSETIIMSEFKLVNKIAFAIATFLITSAVWTVAFAQNQTAAQANAKSLSFNRSKSALPQSNQLNAPAVQPHNLLAVKPPRSDEFYEQDAKQAEYEHLLDQEIKKLYELSQQYRRSSNRGELWLRLAERYVEKARLVDFREQAVYDKKIKEYLDKKSHVKPVLNQRAAREYNHKAVELYEWFLKDFPKDAKIDQSLFFLGYNYFEMGDAKRGEDYYRRLIKEYPNSVYVTESYFALGEYYFESEKWSVALDAYMKVISKKRARLNLFALYKSAWCLYRLNRVDTALKALERVVRLSGGAGEQPDGVAGGRAVNRVRLGSEALRDYVPFYSESGEYKNASDNFTRVAQDDKKAHQMLERLAYTYFDNGNRTASSYLFKELISQDPVAEKAAEYQYRIVLSLVTSDPKMFRQELSTWMDVFGPDSTWAKENSKNQKLISDMAKLQETVLRNHVLQLHQTAQNSRAPYTQQAANAAYALYFKHFANAPQATEMVFFRAELLFDMEKYEDASKLYTYVADKEPNGKYYERAIVNNVLALEKDLPSAKEIDEKRGKSLDPIPFDPAVARFEKGALRYIAAFPKGDKVQDILRRLGVLYYSYNQFDKAVDIFERILKDYPGTNNAEIAGNLILDIYKLRGDMAGLADKGNQLLQNPRIANSKFGEDIRKLLERASYLKADKAAASGDSAKAAKEFETYATNYKQSDLALAARYKAAAAYEKAGDVPSAVRMHSLVLTSTSKDPKVVAVQNDSRSDLARIYQQTGQLELAAREYERYAQALGPKEQKSINAYYNAAVLQDGLNSYTEAFNNYQRYLDGSKKSDRFEVVYAQADLSRRQGNNSRADSLYEKYLNSPVSNKEHIAKAHYLIAKRAEAQGKKTRADEWFKKINGLNNRFKKQGSDAATGYAAEGRFRTAQDTLAEMRRVKFTKNEKQQANAAKQLEGLRAKYINEMKEVVRFDNAPMIVAALASTGQMFELIAKTYSQLPAPAGYSADDAKKLQELMDGKVKELQGEAKNSYTTAYDKALELESFGEWTKVAADGLARYDASVGLQAGEQVSESKQIDWMGL